MLSINFEEFVSRSIVIFKTTRLMTTKETDLVAEILPTLGLTSVSVMNISAMESVDIITEEMMDKMGWISKERLKQTMQEAVAEVEAERELKALSNIQLTQEN